MLKLLKPLSHHARTVLDRMRGAAPRRTLPPDATAGGACSEDGALPAELMARLGRPVRMQTAELSACDKRFLQGRDLARQDRWATLCSEMTEADAIRATTTAGAPIAELLAAGARSDLGRALQDASAAGDLATRQPMFDALEMLDEAAQPHRDDPASAALMALTHMDAGWAWYTQGWQRGRPERHIREFRRAFARADALLAPFSPAQTDSPFLASAHCALLAGCPDAEDRVVDAYDRLIALAPGMPGHMRAYGLHLLPCWFGSHSLLEREARRMAARSTAVWGAGAYSWVYLDALVQDAGCLDQLDTGFFLEGLDDILARRRSQHMVNLLAAYLSQMLRASRDADQDRAQRRALTLHRDRLIRDAMTESHPLVWAIADKSYATPGAGYLGEATLAEGGTLRAWEAISTVFSRDLRRLPTGPISAR